MAEVSPCPDVARYRLLVSGQLPSEEKESLLRHLEGCDSCARLVELLRQTRAHADDSSGDRVAGLVERLSNQQSAAPHSAGDDQTFPPSPHSAALPPFTCPACGKKWRVKDGMAGKKIRCPGCGQVLTLPRGDGDGSAAADQRTLLPSPAPLSPARDQASPPGGERPPDCRPNNLDVTCDSTFSGGAADSCLIDFLSPAQAADELGRLGKYRILQVLGHGGMGVVYKAEDTLLKRLVAIKAMLPALAASVSAGKRFLREAQAMAAVEHDHIVRVLDVSEERGVPFLVMELLKGEPLDVRLEREKTLPVREVVRLGKEMAEGLAAAHEHGLIHRDIKPGNVWLAAPKNRVKILDFGLARSVAQQSELTQQGSIIGTPAYMAPEQGRGEAVNARSDLFSLGCVLYRMLTGSPAFQGRDAVSTLLAVATNQPPPPRVANPESPAALSGLVMQLLEKAPERRPPSAAVVAEALHALEQELLAPTGRTEVMSPLPQQESAPAPRRRLPLLVGTLLLLAGLVGLGLWGSGVFRVSGEQGDLVLESDDPDFAFVPVKGGGLTLEDRKAKRTYALEVVSQGEGKYQLEVADKGADLVFHTEKFTVERGDKVALKAWFERKVAGPFVLEFMRNGRVEVPTLKLNTPGPLTLEATVAFYFYKPVFIGSGILVGHPEGPCLAYHSYSHGHFALPGVKDAVAGCDFGRTPSKYAWVYTGAEALLFENGKLRKRQAVAGVRPELVQKPFWIGQNLNGRISEVRISRSARYTANYDAAKPLTADDDTLAFYPCNEDAGYILKDASGHGHHGKILGGRCVTLDGVPGPPPLPPIEPAWFEKVASLPAEKRLEAVLDKLKERNPFFTGEVRGKKIEDDVVAELDIAHCPLMDVSPVRALRGLRGLRCEFTHVPDLAQLRGLHLSHLNCCFAPVADLKPLQGMPLTILNIRDTRVTDLTPLKDLPLKELSCSFEPKRDTAILRSIKTLEKINGKPAADFWKEVDGKPPDKKP